MTMLTSFRPSFYVLLSIFMLIFSLNAHAGWRDLLKELTGGEDDSTAMVKKVAGGLSESDMVEG